MACSGCRVLPLGKISDSLVGDGELSKCFLLLFWAGKGFMAADGKLRSLIRKIFLIDLLEGMWVTLRYDVAVGAHGGKPKDMVTEQYPAERPPVAERYRGAPRLNIN